MVQQTGRTGNARALTPAEHKNSRLGIWLFVIYVILYAGFMGLAAFDREMMGRPTPLGGVNVAIVYGMGLIGGALLLALLYTWLCQREPQPDAAKGGEEPSYTGEGAR
jgi:uncharacterized membrane protein (DUF485 family)